MAVTQKQLNKVIKKSPKICTPLMRLSEVSSIMLKDNCGFLPVVGSLERLNPIGVITDRDIVCRSIAKGLNPMNLQVRDVMSNECFTLDSGATLAQASKLMDSKKVRRLVLTDKDGKCCGVISKADLADYSLKRPKAVRKVRGVIAKKTAARRAGWAHARAH